MLAKSAVLANLFLLAISTNASTLAVAADDLRRVCRLCRVCQEFLADTGQNGQNVVAGAQRGQAQRDGRVERNEIELPKSESVHLYSIRYGGQFQRLSW